MQEQIVTFEVAKLAKRAGFTFGPLYAHHSKFYTTNGKIISWGRHGRLTFSDLTYAPTQTDLQKWLREKKKVLIYVFPIDNWNNYGYRVLGEDVMAPFFIMAESQTYGLGTWENALERGLFIALNTLI